MQKSEIKPSNYALKISNVQIKYELRPNRIKIIQSETETSNNK